MATLTPQRTVAIAPDPLDSGSIITALRPWRRRLFLRQVLHWTAGGIIAGLMLVCLVLIIARIVPWAIAPYVAFSLGIVCVVLTLAASIWLRPTIAGTAHIADEQLKLYDRLSTAWEMRDQTSALTRLQRRDALKQLGKHRPGEAIPLGFKRSTLLLLLGAVIVLALLIALPNPMNDVLKQQEAFQTQIAQQVKAIDKARQVVNQQSNTTAAQKKQIDQILRDLEAKLQQAQNETQAQQAIADAQAKLNQLQNPQAANNIQGQNAAGTALQNSSDQNLHNAGQALSNNDSQSLAKALQNLASQVSKMTPDQRARQAQQLEQAANQASQNPALSSALHQLAQAITDNNPSEISDATNAVQQAANQDATQQAQSSAINQASQSLQQSANALASSADNSASQTQSGQEQGQSGQQGQNNQANQSNQNNANGQTQGQGQGQAQGQGQNQSNQGQGQGQNQGQGQGQGSQSQGSQGQGGQGGSQGTGNQQGQNKQVYVPGQASSGASTQTTDNNNSSVQQGTSVPYNQVVQQYSQAAHDAIDNSNAPPDVKDLVHNYFDTLEGQH
jgi:hypothetical protein